MSGSHTEDFEEDALPPSRDSFFPVVFPESSKAYNAPELENSVRGWNSDIHDIRKGLHRGISNARRDLEHVFKTALGLSDLSGDEVGEFITHVDYVSDPHALLQACEGPQRPPVSLLSRLGVSLRLLGPQNAPLTR